VWRRRYDVILLVGPTSLVGRDLTSADDVHWTSGELNSLTSLGRHIRPTYFSIFYGGAFMLFY
jgi:hypothetical protein